MTESKTKIRVVSAAIIKDGHYLITRRNESAVLPLLWEFPGGRVEPNESDAEALQRELQERVGIHAEIGEKIARTECEYEKYTVELFLYQCDLGPIPPETKNVHEFRWVASQDFDKYEFTPADQESMDALLFAKT